MCPWCGRNSHNDCQLKKVHAVAKKQQRRPLFGAVLPMCRQPCAANALPLFASFHEQAYLQDCNENVIGIER